MNSSSDPIDEDHRPSLKRPSDQIETLSRRSFLGVLIGFGSVVVGAALSVPLIRFALHPLLTTTTEIGWSDVGKIDEFVPLIAPIKKLIRVEQRDAWRKIISEKAIYVLPTKDGQLKVLSPICPHLGCSIPWNESKQQFICPCHAAVFARDGARTRGRRRARWMSWKAKSRMGFSRYTTNTFASSFRPKKFSPNERGK